MRAVRVFRRILAGFIALNAALAAPIAAQSVVDDSGASNATARIEARRIHPTVTLGGTIVPFKVVTLAAQIPGRVVHVAGEEGDQFQEGTLLISVDEEELLARRAAAMTMLRDADNQMRKAGVAYNRELWSPRGSPANKAPGGMGMPSMFDQFFTTPMQSMMGQQQPALERYTDLYVQGTQIEQARNATARAQSQLRQIDAKLRNAKSIAPFSGMILKKVVEEGDTIQPGQPLLEFADTRYVQIEVHVPARLMYGGLKEGDVVDARLDESNRFVDARVAQVFPMADPKRHTVRTKLDLRVGTFATPGTYAEVMIPDPAAKARKTVLVPESAVIRRGSLPMVYVDVGAGKRKLKLIRLGERQPGGMFSVLSGLNAGQMVYLKPPRR